jgi:hypothetical protein
MKRNIIAAILIALMWTCTMEANETNGLPSVTFKSAYANKYLAFGSGSVLYDKPVIQSDLFISFPCGFYLDLWNSKSLEGKWNENFGNEVDYGIGWAGSVHGYSINIGVTYFDEPDVFTLGAGDILYSHASIAHAYWKWMVSATWENYVTMPNTGIEGGNLFSIGIARSFQLHERVQLNTSTAIVYDDGGFGRDDGFLQKGNVGLDWKITEKLTLNAPSVNFYVPISVHDARNTDSVIFAGLTYRF